MTPAHAIPGRCTSPGIISRARFVWLIRLLCAFLLTGFAPSTYAQGQAALPVLQLSAGLHLIRAEVAATPPQLQQGLMFRRTMAPQEGMLFVFGQKHTHCMWMVNTEIPLSVAFLRDDGSIVNIEDMEPHSRDSHCAKEPVSFALEMNQGWFKQRGIEAGSRIRGLPELRY